jgi:hypothetical protein
MLICNKLYKLGSTQVLAEEKRNTIFLIQVEKNGGAYLTSLFFMLKSYDEIFTASHPLDYIR